METVLGPIRERYFQLMANPETVYNFLEQSAQKCRTLAQETMAEVRQKIGIR